MSGLAPVRLLCNGRVDPVGIDLEHGPPQLRWAVEGTGRGRRQTTARVLALRVLPDGSTVLLWDSGEVVTSAPSMAYAGPSLRSEDRVRWSVQVRDEAGDLGPVSEPAEFLVALLDSDDWVARWISHPRERASDGTGVSLPRPAPVLRTEVDLEGDPVAARLYVCGLGFHEVRINGSHVGDHALAPVPTVYDRRALYAVHDVTCLLRQGRNALAVMLGTGWFDYHTEDPWGFARASWRDRPKLLLQLSVDLHDGRRVVIGSGPTWRVSRGAIRFDGIRNGERVDGRLVQSGSDEVGFDDTRWHSAEVVSGPGGRLVVQTVPIVVGESLPARSVTLMDDGDVVVDLGQNIAGRLSVEVCGVQGTELVIRHGEQLDPSGRVDQSPISMFTRSGEFQTDRYTLAGGGTERWEPRFTYHGFQYTQISGWPGPADPTSFTARVLHSDMARAGSFRCSEPILERIFEATRWSYVSNFVGFPTDCPQREKNGWTGDALIAAESGLLMYSSAPAYRQWLDSLRDVQRPDGSVPGIVPTAGWGYTFPPDGDLAGPVWDSAVIQLPWTIHRFTDDIELLEHHYDGMVRYFDLLSRTAVDGVVNYGLGDWCPPGSFEGHSCPEAVTSTAYYYTDADVLAQIGDLLGRHDDAAGYRRLARSIRRAFVDAFVDGTSGWVTGRDLTSQSCALAFGLVDGIEADRVLARLIEVAAAVGHHPWAGILGASWAPRVLSDHGHVDTALALVTTLGYPGWRHWMDQGATTLWETWEGTTSRNHIMFGDVAAWMMTRLGGIRPDDHEPGFARVVVRPTFPSALTWVEAQHDSPRGRVRVAWRRTADEIAVDVDIPAGTRGDVHLPVDWEVLESGLSLTDSGLATRVSQDGRDRVIEAGSGAYAFTVRPVR